MTTFLAKDDAIEESQFKAKERRESGEFVRGVSSFRCSIGDQEFLPEPGRYHLFVALNCPWCHRVTLARNILGLQQSITMDVAFPNRTDETDPEGPNFWEFSPKRIASLTGQRLPECTHETGTGKGLRLAKDIYFIEGSREQSLPILYDKQNRCIVSNESAEIIRMLDLHARALSKSGPSGPQLFPDDTKIQDQIALLNERIYTNINNGAYKAGFSSDQTVYEDAFRNYFSTLNFLNELLSDNRPFLTGTCFTEADLRLFPTLFRHDPIYYIRMKLNGARILDYPYLWKWLCRVYALDGVVDAGSLIHCRQGYFGRSWNGIVPIGALKPMQYPEAYEHPELVSTNHSPH